MKDYNQFWKRFIPKDIDSHYFPDLSEPNPIGCYYIGFDIPNYNKIYFGATTNIVHRKSVHFYKLQRNAHHNEYLQNAYNLYKEHVFFQHYKYFKDQNECFQFEKDYINLLDLRNREKGFNFREGGFCGGGSIVPFERFFFIGLALRNGFSTQTISEFYDIIPSTIKKINVGISVPLVKQTLAPNQQHIRLHTKKRTIVSKDQEKMILELALKQTKIAEIARLVKLNPVTVGNRVRHLYK